MMRALLLVPLLTIQAQVPLIDLVAKPSIRKVGRGSLISGFSTDAPQPPKPTAPLTVKLETISRFPQKPGLRIVEILVTNVSGAPYLLPVGRDGDAALKAGNHGRRQVWFRLRSPRRSDDLLGTLAGSATYASADMDDSFLTLPAGGSVRVRFPADLSDIRAVEQWRAAGITGVEVHVALTIEDLNDNCTEIDCFQNEFVVDSGNTTRLDLD